MKDHYFLKKVVQKHEGKMKKPSRLMPKYIPPKELHTFWKWTIWIVTSSILIIIFWDKPSALLLFIPIYIVGYFSFKKSEKKLQKLARERKGVDIGNFAKSFDCKKIDTWIIRAVYEQLQEYIIVENFPILANDDLWKDLEIDNEDFSYNILEEIAQRTNRTLDKIEENPYFNVDSTVKNLVLLFNEQNIIKDNKTLEDE